MWIASVHITPLLLNHATSSTFQQNSIQQNQQPTRSATWKPKYVEIEQGEEADCEEGKEVGFQNESGTIPSWQKLPKKYIPCHYHFRRPAKAEEDEADGEMSAMLLAMAAFLLKSLVLPVL